MKDTSYNDVLPLVEDIESLKIFLMKRRGWVIVIPNFDLIQEKIVKELIFIITYGYIEIEKNVSKNQNIEKPPMIEHKINFIVVSSSKFSVSSGIKKSNIDFKYLGLKFPPDFLQQIDLTIDLSRHNEKQKLIERFAPYNDAVDLIDSFLKNNDHVKSYELNDRISTNIKENKNNPLQHLHQTTIKKKLSRNQFEDSQQSQVQNSKYSFFNDNWKHFDKEEKKVSINEENTILDNLKKNYNEADNLLYNYFNKLGKLNSCGYERPNSLKKLILCIRLFRTIILRQPKIFKSVINKISENQIEVETFDVILGIMLYQETQITLYGLEYFHFGSDLCKFFAMFEGMGQTESIKEERKVVNNATQSAMSDMNDGQTHW